MTNIFENPAPTLAEVNEAIQRLIDRENKIRARFSELDAQYARLALIGTVSDLKTITDEGAGLRQELELVPGRIDKLLSMQTAAEKREAPGVAKAAYKPFLSLLERAEKARAEWLNAKEALNQQAAVLGHNLTMAWEGGHHARALTEEEFQRLSDISDWSLPANPNRSDPEVRAKASRLIGRRKSFCNEDHDTALEKIGAGILNTGPGGKLR